MPTDNIQKLTFFSIRRPKKKNTSLNTTIESHSQKKEEAIKSLHDDKGTGTNLYNESSFQ